MTVLTNKINKKKLNKKQFLGAFVGACVALGGTVELCDANVVMAAPADHATQQNTTQGISEAESFLTKGITLAQQKRFAEAIIAYNKAVKEKGNKASDLDILVAGIMKLPYGQLKKVLTEEVLAVLKKYGIEKES